MGEVTYTFRIEEEDYEALQAIQLLTGNTMKSFVLQSIRDRILSQPDVPKLIAARTQEIQTAGSVVANWNAEQR